MEPMLDTCGTARSDRRLQPAVSRKIVLVSCLLSFGIILYHANPATSFSSITGGGTLFSLLTAIFNSLGGLGVSFFFLTAAFLFYYNLTRSNLGAKLARRVRSLLVPYLLWNGIMYLLLGFYRTGTDRIYLNVLLSKYADWFWFVGALLLLALAAPVCLAILRNPYVGAAAVALVYVFALLDWFGLGGLLPAGLAADRFLGYLPVYFTGAYAGMHAYSIVNAERYPNWVRYAAILLLSASYAVALPVVSELLILLRAPLLWIALPARWFSREPKWWQQLSFYTYATHVFFLTKLKALVALVVDLDYIVISAGNALLWRLALSAAALLLVLVSARLLIRFAPKAYAALTGGRGVPNCLAKRPPHDRDALE